MPRADKRKAAVVILYVAGLVGGRWRERALEGGSSKGKEKKEKEGQANLIKLKKLLFSRSPV